MPSQLDALYWSNSLRDLKSRVDLRSQFEVAKVNQTFESLVQVVSMALGGDDTSAEEEAVGSYDELERAVRMMTGIHVE